MNDNDIEIILALANGTLTGDEERRARRRVEADPELAAELAAQIAAVESLDALPPVSLTDAERSTLRASLVEQLGLEPAAAPPARRRALSWWKPVLGLASAAAVALAFVVVPSMLSSNQSEEAGVALVSETDMAGEPTTTAAAGGDEEMAATTMAGTTLARAEDGETYALPEVPLTGAPELLAATVDSSDEPSSKLGEAGSLPTTAVSAAELADCIDRLDDDLPPSPLVPFAVTTTEDAQIVHLALEGAGDPADVVRVSLPDCSIVPAGP